MSFLSDIKNKAGELKNAAISLLAKNFINNKIKEYGEMVDLHIDSVQKNIDLDILLKGEKESISIHIEKYEIIKKDDSAYIKFKKVTSSREWITVLLENEAIPNYAPNNTIEIDPAYAKIIDLLV